MRQLQLAVAMGALLVAAASFAAGDKPAADYFCSRFEARIIFDEHRIIKDFGYEFPDTEEPSAFPAKTAGSISGLLDCSNADFWCIEDRVTSGTTANAEVRIYAVPRTLKVGQTYQVRGTTFDVRPHLQFVGLPNSVVVIAHAETPPGNPVRYKMYVQKGKGVTGFYFDKIRAYALAPTQYRDFDKVSCALVSRNGLFPKVEIEKYIPPEALD
jgi:hypothetical protein